MRGHHLLPMFGVGEPAIPDHHRGKAFRITGDDCHADEAAPVLAEQHRVLKVELFDQRRDPVDMSGIGVVALLRWFVRAAEADEVGDNDPAACFDEAGDHLAVQIPPGGLAVDQQHRASCLGPHVDVGKSERNVDVRCGDCCVAWLVWPVREVNKSFVGRSLYVHGHLQCSACGWA